MPRTLLLVDDDPNIRETAVDILEDAGYEVSTSGSSGEALAILAGQPVDLVITDMSLPDHSGEVLAREIRQRYPRIRILILSGQQDLNTTALAAVSDAVLLKPIDPPLLLAIIKKSLDQ